MRSSPFLPLRGEPRGKLLKSVHWLNNLKVRTSIGETGNQEIGNYAFFQNLGSENAIFGDNYYTALYRSTFGNPDLKMGEDLAMGCRCRCKRIESAYRFVRLLL